MQLPWFTARGLAGSQHNVGIVVLDVRLMDWQTDARRVTEGLRHVRLGGTRRRVAILPPGPTYNAIRRRAAQTPTAAKPPSMRIQLDGSGIA